MEYCKLRLREIDCVIFEISNLNRVRRCYKLTPIYRVPFFSKVTKYSNVRAGRGSNFHSRKCLLSDDFQYVMPTCQME